MASSNLPVVDATMALTGQEIQWVQEIKEAVVASPDLNELSDFEYAQHALVTKGDVEDALRRIQGLKDFREEYQIHDTLEEGMELLHSFSKQHPWFVLDVEYESQYGHFVCVYDCGSLRLQLRQGMAELSGGSLLHLSVAASEFAGRARRTGTHLRV